MNEQDELNQRVKAARGIEDRPSDCVLCGQLIDSKRQNEHIGTNVCAVCSHLIDEETGYF